MAMMPKATAMIGGVFGRLRVLGLAGKDKHSNALVDCVCECGATGVYVGSRLRSGETRSCGCLHLELLQKPAKHGLTRTGSYRSWQSMKQRCQYLGSIVYANYGGRGIKVCERWDGFEAFYADMGDRPPGATLDRINSDGDYEPGNCRWATPTEQNRNRRDNRRFQYQGESRTIPEIAAMVGLKTDTLRARLCRYGYSLEEAVKSWP